MAGTHTREWFEAVVDEIIEALPAWVVDAVDNLQIVVEDAPTRDQDPTGDGLLGLYEGVSLHDRGNDYYAVLPDTIYVFRRPHLAMRLPPDELRSEIRTTVLHELAHHLGIDDDRLHDLGWD